MRRLLSALVFAALSACSPGEATPATSTSPAAGQPLPTIAATEAGGAPIVYEQHELAVTSPDGAESVRFDIYDAYRSTARQHGLMGVTDLPDTGGMLFRFAQAQRNGFWMKNTLIPLSIAYADGQGAIRTILDMEPCKADPCPTYVPDEDYSYALEVRQGVFSERGIEEGWTLQVPDDLPAAD